MPAYPVGDTVPACCPAVIETGKVNTCDSAYASPQPEVQPLYALHFVATMDNVADIYLTLVTIMPLYVTEVRMANTYTERRSLGESLTLEAAQRPRQLDKY